MKKKRRYTHRKRKEIEKIIILVSIILNMIFLIKINNLNTLISKNKSNYNKQLNELKNNYTNYVFLGDSITDFYDLDKYFKDMPVVNSGISGNTTDDILNNMKTRLYQYNPSKVFLQIGTNDLIYDKDVNYIVSNIKKITNEIKKEKKEVEIYIESLYPVNSKINKSMVGTRSNEDIKKINKKINEYCNENGYTYINIFDILKDEKGKFNKEYTDDGLHPNDRGYSKITKEIRNYLD